MWTPSELEGRVLTLERRQAATVDVENTTSPVSDAAAAFRVPQAAVLRVVLLMHLQFCAVLRYFGDSKIEQKKRLISAIGWFNVEVCENVSKLLLSAWL